MQGPISVSAHELHIRAPPSESQYWRYTAALAGRLVSVRSTASAPTKARGPLEWGRRVLTALAPALKTVPADQPPGLHVALAFHLDEPHRLRDKVVAQELPGRTGDLDLV